MNNNKLREVQALASYYRYEVRHMSGKVYVVHDGFGRDLHDTALYKGTLEQVEGFVDGLRHALQTLPDLLKRQAEYEANMSLQFIAGFDSGANDEAVRQRYKSSQLYRDQYNVAHLALKTVDQDVLCIVGDMLEQEEGDDYDQIQSDMCEAMSKWLSSEIRRKREGV